MLFVPKFVISIPQMCFWIQLLFFLSDWMGTLATSSFTLHSFPLNARTLKLFNFKNSSSLSYRYFPSKRLSYRTLNSRNSCRFRCFCSHNNDVEKREDSSSKDSGVKTATPDEADEKKIDEFGSDNTPTSVSSRVICFCSSFLCSF